MDSKTEEKGESQESTENVRNSEKEKESSEVETKSSAGPVIVFLWMWNWISTIPKTVTNLYADFKSGELLARFTLLDAMLQFLIAVATSCHPQEEPMSGESEEHKTTSYDNSQSSKTKKDVFSGSGRTLRSRVVEAAS